MNEEFSEKDAEALKQAILSDHEAINILSGTNIADYKNILIHKAYIDTTNNDTYNNFFNNHSLELVKAAIVKAFVSHGEMAALNEIVKRDGLFNLEKLLEMSSLESLISSSGLRISKDVIKEIYSITDRAHQAAGKFEVLLQLLLFKCRSAGNNRSGDIIVDNTTIEIKTSGSRPSGHRGTLPSKIIFNRIDTVFNGSDNNIVADEIGVMNYTTKEFDTFKTRLQEYTKNNKASDITTAIIDAVKDQYSVEFSNNSIEVMEHTFNGKLNDLTKLNKDDLKNFIGSLQFYCYCISSGWDYLIYINNSDLNYTVIEKDSVVDSLSKIKFDGQDFNNTAPKMMIKNK